MSETTTSASAPTPDQGVTHGALGDILKSLEARFASLEACIHQVKTAGTCDVHALRAELGGEIAMVKAEASALFASASK